MTCIYKSCAADNVPDDAVFCHICGRKQVREKRTRVRANGEGCVYQLPNGKYRAVRELGSYLDDNGTKHRITRSKSFAKKSDAMAYLPKINNARKEKTVTLKQLYDLWVPTHVASKSTMNCYASGMKHLQSLWHTKINDIDIDDLQECISDCPRGKRTRQNMRTAIGLLYKYGIPRGYIDSSLNLADYLKVTGDESEHKEGFTETQVAQIERGVGTVKYADYIYSLIYLGFRPTEFLALCIEDYNQDERAFIGGAKTEAGANRTVTVSPKIQPIVDKLTKGKAEGAIFCDDDGKALSLSKFRDEMFYPTLTALGIDNPTTETPQGKRHKYTPHSCRHTFATLMKRVDAPSKDKLELIGHASDEMLRYYQDVSYADLRKITDKI